MGRLNSECAAFTPHALDGYRAVMHFDQRLREVEANTRAGNSYRSFGPEEFVEHVWQIILIYTKSMIPNLDDYILTFNISLDQDIRRVGRIFNGV